ncbi:MAG: cytochrome c biogenesis protein CcdA [Defluviitaleaceae bacterium]|nr:cytochrome c biogenesis protein CcdA [Defluviitaleaceae bacterium]
MIYLLLFLEGFITFISPCLLPLLPVYISFFAAGRSDKFAALKSSLGFVCGFTLVFVLLGAFAGTVGSVLFKYTVLLNAVSGIFLVVLGLNFMGVINITLSASPFAKYMSFSHGYAALGHGGMSRHAACEEQRKTPRGAASILFGIIFAIGWSPCVGSFLGAALMKAASRGGTLHGALMLLVYSAGLALPFVISAVLMAQLKGAFDIIKRNYKKINFASGVLLIITGVLIASGLMGRYLALFAGGA